MRRSEKQRLLKVCQENLKSINSKGMSGIDTIMLGRTEDILTRVIASLEKKEEPIAARPSDREKEFRALLAAHPNSEPKHTEWVHRVIAALEGENR